MSTENEEIVAVVIGDPHIRTKEIEYSQLMMDEIVDISKKAQPDFIVVLGDILDTHNAIDSSPLTRATEFLFELHKIAKLIVLIGNHDLRNNRVYFRDVDVVEHGFRALHEWDNTIVCDKPKVFEIKGKKFCGVPYVPVGKYHDAISDVNIDEITAFFSHQEFYKVQYTLNDKPSTTGDRWSKKYPLNISGHIHEAQILSDNLIYVGTPIQQDHGASPDKGIGLFVFGRPSERNGSRLSYTYERLPLSSVPLREQYFVSAENSDELTKLLRRIKKKMKSRVLLAKIVISGTTTELKPVMKSKVVKDLRELEGVIVIPDIINFTPETINKLDVPKSAQTFKKLVEVSLKEEPKLKELYNELFSDKMIGDDEDKDDDNESIEEIIVKKDKGKRKRRMVK